MIGQTDSTLTFGDPSGRGLTVYFDGRPTMVGPSIEVNGRWKKRRFEVRRTLPERGTIVDVYERSKDLSKLTVRERYEGSRDGPSPPETQRVYEFVSR